MGHALLVQQKLKKNLQILISSFQPSTEKKGIFTHMWKMVIDRSKGLWPMGGTGTWDERGDTGGKERVTSWSPGQTVWNSLCQSTLSPRVSQAPWCFVHQTSSSLSSSPSRSHHPCSQSQWLGKITWYAPSPSVMRKDHVMCLLLNDERSRDMLPPFFSEGDGWDLPIYAFSFPFSLFFFFFLRGKNFVKIEFQMAGLSRSEETLYYQVT